jgi:hypothetical protein
MTRVDTDEFVRPYSYDMKTPDLVAALDRAETAAQQFANQQGGVLMFGMETQRQQALDALAEWSVESAELDWDHLADVDQRAWGTEAP